MYCCAMSLITSQQWGANKSEVELCLEKSPTFLFLQNGLLPNDSPLLRQPPFRQCYLQINHMINNSV